MKGSSATSEQNTNTKVTTDEEAKELNESDKTKLCDALESNDDAARCASSDKSGDAKSCGDDKPKIDEDVSSDVEPTISKTPSTDSTLPLPTEVVSSAGDASQEAVERSVEKQKSSSLSSTSVKFNDGDRDDATASVMEVDESCPDATAKAIEKRVTTQTDSSSDAVPDAASQQS